MFTLTPRNTLKTCRPLHGAFILVGYQPAQKWLKYRKGRALNMDDVQHYQKIIYALTETQRLMQEIDMVFSVT